MLILVIAVLAFSALSGCDNLRLPDFTAPFETTPTISESNLPDLATTESPPVEATMIPPTTQGPGVITPVPQPTLTPMLTPTPFISHKSLGIVFSRGEVARFWHEGTITPLDIITTTCNRVEFSDDKQLIAYPRSGQLRAMRINGTGKRLVVNKSDLQAMYRSATGQVIVSVFKWLPGTHDLLFSTTEEGQAYPIPMNDLFKVNVDTLERSQILPAGESGYFSPSPDGKVIAISKGTSISLINADGSQLRTVLEFAQVATHAEYEYYPIPAWATDSGSFLVAIPPAEPIKTPFKPTTIWRILVDRAQPVQLSIIYNGLGKVYFSPELTAMAYIIPSLSGDMPDELHVARVDGSVDYSYTILDKMKFIGWVPDSQHFVIEQDVGKRHIYLKGRLDGPSPMSDESVPQLKRLEQWKGFYAFNWDVHNLLVMQSPEWNFEARFIARSDQVLKGLAVEDTFCRFTTLPQAAIPTSTVIPEN